MNPLNTAGPGTSHHSAETAKPSRHYLKGPVPLPALLLIASSWALLWTQTSYWNPLFFAGTWLGAALLMYAVGPEGHPGWRRHLALSVVSVPLWWWFELVNSRVDNWQYVTLYNYGPVSYAVLASVTFSTVAPALDAAWRLTAGLLAVSHTGRETSPGSTAYLIEAGAGGLAVALVFIVPDVFFPLVWVGPFMVFDGVIGRGGGRSLVDEVLHRRWRLPVAVGLAGLLCGVLWEFWNFWATPRWTYHLAHFDYLDVFEMPALGYLGYIPFAWGVYQLLRTQPLEGYLSSSIGEGEGS